MHTSKKLLKDDEVFNIEIDTLDNDIINVRILGMNYLPQLLDPEKDINGKHDWSFPTKYTIKNGKLFYWYDPNYVITQEIMDIMLAYDQIYYMRWEYDFPDMLSNDFQDAAKYFFYRYDLTCYKKIESHIMSPTPELNCKQKPKEKPQKSNFPKLLPY